MRLCMNFYKCVCITYVSIHVRIYIMYFGKFGMYESTLVAEYGHTVSMSSQSAYTYSLPSSNFDREVLQVVSMSQPTVVTCGMPTARGFNIKPSPLITLFLFHLFPVIRMINQREPSPSTQEYSSS